MGCSIAQASEGLPAIVRCAPVVCVHLPFASVIFFKRLSSQYLPSAERSAGPFSSVRGHNAFPMWNAMSIPSMGVLSTSYALCVDVPT